MYTLVVPIFAASVLGSLHCAGMCGAFLAIAISSPGERPRWAPQAAYHLGRLATYLAMGTAAGAIGKALDLSSSLAGIGPVAAALAGVTMVLFGVATFLKLRGVSVFGRWQRSMGSSVLARWTSAGVGFAMNRPVVPRAALIGLLTTLLPCGWLYLFVATAAGTAHPVSGAVAMAAFWAGTLPVMVTLGTGLRAVLGVVGGRLPQLTCLFLVVFGLFTLFGRSQLSAVTLLQRTATAAADTASVPSTRPACCEPEGVMP
jgi:sulfite exporter TauE/SafE